MTKITELQPTALWTIFDQMTQIPRPSNHEEKIQEWAYNFGKELGLETLRDKVGNIIIRKPATLGMENRKPVILQAHLDMVPQKNGDKQHDFTKDPIETIVDGDWVRANGTTLGADNGVGASSIFAVLASKDIAHGPLEALFTATEETGMDGANKLQRDVLNGKILINTDSEDEGELYVGCAGGEDVTAKFNYEAKKTPDGYVGFKISVTGMKGGHSGIDIVLGRGNAIKVFFRILDFSFFSVKARLASIDGGSLRNAIPREAFGVVAVKKKRAQEFLEEVHWVADTIQ
ncbi:MAG: beta-Ala-His dipeptidase, partial [Prolixibacteraceae bacterium]|nr:beta-Ala-His dipeptidase [Prolixibacteraceae bacterium]